MSIAPLPQIDNLSSSHLYTSIIECGAKLKVRALTNSTAARYSQD
jgi:hypothetical protein